MLLSVSVAVMLHSPTNPDGQSVARGTGTQVDELGFSVTRSSTFFLPVGGGSVGGGGVGGGSVGGGGVGGGSVGGGGVGGGSVGGGGVGGGSVGGGSVGGGSVGGGSVGGGGVGGGGVGGTTTGISEIVTVFSPGEIVTPPNVPVKISCASASKASRLNVLFVPTGTNIVICPGNSKVCSIVEKSLPSTIIVIVLMFSLSGCIDGSVEDII